MSASEASWVAGINGLSIPSLASGGDIPEAQFDAIVAAAGPGTFTDPTVGEQPDCGWRSGSNVTHVLVVATDATFHTPDGTHQNDSATTTTALLAQDIRVIGLKAPGAGTELDTLATNTGGSVQPLSSDGMNIGSAIVAGLGNLRDRRRDGEQLQRPDQHDVRARDAERHVRRRRPLHRDDQRRSRRAQGQTFECDDWATINGEPMTDANGDVILEHKTIHVPDVTPPTVQCVEGPNPNGKKIPPAGSTTLPGPKGGQNEDGFYRLLAVDNVDPNPKIYRGR